jgi:quinol-cytochrome oxidoreductase complex cytochrome b subunit
LVLALVLAGTGLGLWFNYRPTAPTVGVPRLRTIHRAASFLLVLDAVAFLVLVVVDSRRRWPRGVWAVVTVLALAYTGSLLPWDQLALRAVTVGTDIRGMSATWDRGVRFILIGGVEVSPSTFRRWAIAHVVAIPAIGLLVPAAVVLLRRLRGLRKDQDAPRGQPGVPHVVLPRTPTR